MIEQTSFLLEGRKPDVLSCIANLSSDEVFTPPELACQMLDVVAEAWALDYNGANIWEDKTIKFLDPCAKSGIFLREVTRRLVEGLRNEIPCRKKRVQHILTQQVFGIGITQLTSLLARRTLYCSKYANSDRSIVKSFETPEGNIWFERIEHTWGTKKCKFCKAPRKKLDRESTKENYAYAFIHTRDIKSYLAELFGGIMQFDVIIGNPPYQMEGGAGGTSASSIYQLFVEQAKQLEPKYLSMVIPSRWLAGGRGLSGFRKEMLGSHKLHSLVDFPVSREVFPNVEVKGGICYFLWSDRHDGPCNVTVIRSGEETSSLRQLDEFDVFVRDPIAVRILRKILMIKEPSITDILTADTPFGIATNYCGFNKEKKKGDIPLYYVRDRQRGIGFVARSVITRNRDLIDKWKVLVPEAAHGTQTIPSAVLGKPWISPPPSVATQTFLAFCVESENEANSLKSYYLTKFFRYIVSQRKITQHALRQTYTWVPIQTWDREWTDEALYKKYKLTTAEVDHIESVIRNTT